MVTKEEPEKYDDNSLDKEFVDVTQIIEDKSDSIETSQQYQQKLEISPRFLGGFIIKPK